MVFTCCPQPLFLDLQVPWQLDTLSLDLPLSVPEAKLNPSQTRSGSLARGSTPFGVGATRGFSIELGLGSRLGKSGPEPNLLSLNRNYTSIRISLCLDEHNLKKKKFITTFSLTLIYFL